MAAAAVGMEIVNPAGQIESISSDRVKQYLHTFGSTGAVVSITMQVEPEYAVKKCIYQNMPWSFLNSDEQLFNEVINAGDFMSFFTDWKQ